MNVRLIILSAAVLILAGCAGDMKLESPSGDISVGFSIDSEGMPHYQVSAYGPSSWRYD